MKWMTAEAVGPLSGFGQERLERGVFGTVGPKVNSKGAATVMDRETLEGFPLPRCMVQNGERRKVRGWLCVNPFFPIPLEIYPMPMAFGGDQGASS